KAEPGAGLLLEKTLDGEDEVILQCTATIHKEQQKLCLAAEGFGNRLCFLESTSNSKNVPPDLSISIFVLEQSLSVQALQEMLANTVEKRARYHLSHIPSPWMLSCQSPFLIVGAEQGDVGPALSLISSLGDPSERHQRKTIS
uniref:Inositol 1,4,5-trisphosphate/ryanodine receptor domain-containing protein n=1 Tax=Spermophilus dauricus TaxID=99837 RepID=A0A8C9QKM2_SPEDA